MQNSKTNKTAKQQVSKKKKINADKYCNDVAKEVEEQKESTYNYVCDKGWNVYIDRCADIIYHNFRNFGWGYGLEDKPVTRIEIEDNIMHLIGESLREKTMIECGRIAVDIVDDELWIALVM